MSRFMKPQQASRACPFAARIAAEEDRAWFARNRDRHYRLRAVKEGEFGDLPDGMIYVAVFSLFPGARIGTPFRPAEPPPGDIEDAPEEIAESIFLDCIAHDPKLRKLVDDFMRAGHA
jgi:hypothetical protein